ncbi:hypothetical protein [Brevundimonas mediterranea]|uniref:hypothetical protein n=1 Tax=Brevundimonas mediterranea TaxID=74329 RepID=UPI0040343E9B
MAPRPPKLSGPPADLETQVFMISAAARSAIEVAAEALGLANERKTEVYDASEFDSLVVEGLRMERNQGGVLSRRGVIGAQAFLSNLVIVENCIMTLMRLERIPPDVLDRAEQALTVLRSVVDRKLRDTAEHIDERVLELTGGLIVNTFFEGDLFCSSRRDGSVGRIAITQATLDQVTAAFDNIFWPPELIARLEAKRLS